MQPALINETHRPENRRHKQLFVLGLDIFGPGIWRSHLKMPKSMKWTFLFFSHVLNLCGKVLARPHGMMRGDVAWPQCGKRLWNCRSITWRLLFWLALKKNTSVSRCWTTAACVCSSFRLCNSKQGSMSARAAKHVHDQRSALWTKHVTATGRRVMHSLPKAHYNTLHKHACLLSDSYLFLPCN